MLRFVFYIIAVLLTSCTTVGSNTVSGLLSVPSDKGIVVFSTGADQTNLSFSTGLWLIDGESSKLYDKVTINIDYPFTSHFPTEHGHVRSLTLKPGLYYLLPVPGNPFFATTRAPVFSFTVKSNSISYLGNLYFSNKQFYISENKKDRDFKYFLDRNPSLIENQIQTRLLNVDRYIYPESPNPFTINGFIWDAPQ